MKKIILFSIVFIFIPFAFAWAAPIDILRQYYEADKNEDIDKMMSLTDFSSVDSSELEEFMSETRKTLEALAEIYNTKYYQISNEEAVIDGDNAIVYYRLKTELEDSFGESMVMDKDFVAVMLNSGGWKIVYTQPKDTFEHNLLVRESLVSLGESYTQEIDFDEFLEEDEELEQKVISENGEQEYKGKKRTGLFIFIVFILVGGFVFWKFFIKKQKDKLKNSIEKNEKQN